jgi:phosphoglycolate phosphatase
MKKYWFFDLDGTLADTEGDIRGSWLATIVDLGLDRARFEERFKTGPSIDEITRVMYPEQYSPGLVEDIRQGFARHYDTGGFPTTVEYPGVIDRVRELKAAGAKVFIATNKRYVATRIMAVHFGWDKIFDGLYSADMHKDDPIGKLDKGGLLALILREIGAEACDAVMVGATISDFNAARHNEIESVEVTLSHGKKEELAITDRLASAPDEI